MYNNIFDLLKSETEAYNTIPVPITENYEWSMSEHINKTILYKNSHY